MNVDCQNGALHLLEHQRAVIGFLPCRRLQHSCPTTHSLLVCICLSFITNTASGIRTLRTQLCNCVSNTGVARGPSLVSSWVSQIPFTRTLLHHQSPKFPVSHVCYGFAEHAGCHTINLCLSCTTFEQLLQAPPMLPAWGLQPRLCTHSRWVSPAQLTYLQSAASAGLIATLSSLAWGQEFVLAFRPSTHAVSQCQDMVLAPGQLERAAMGPAYAAE